MWVAVGIAPLPLGAPAEILIDQIPKLPVLAAFRKIQISRTEIVPHGQPQRDLPGALLQAAVRVSQRGAQVGGYKPNRGVARQRLQLSAGQPSRDAQCGKHRFGAGLRLKRQFEKAGLCVKKTRKRHAVRKDEGAVSRRRGGPSESPCRRRLQTARSCFSQKLRW